MASKAPYVRNDQVAWFTMDTEGVRVNRARVVTVLPESRGWDVITDLGSDVVNDEGEGIRITPIDEFLERELRAKGDGFLVVREDKLRELPPQELRQELGGDGRDHTR